MVKPNMIYTPNNHIPIGEAVQKPDGSLALRVKRSSSDMYDEISMDKLFQDVVRKATPTTLAEPRI